MGERSSTREDPPITRHSTPDFTPLQGYDFLQQARGNREDMNTYEGFSPNPHYSVYMNMPKVFVERKDSQELVTIAEGLKEEWLPDYLDAGGWAAAEASLVGDDMLTSERLSLLETAEDYWQRALTNQAVLNEKWDREYLSEDTKEFRLALNLAFTPLMKSIVIGNVTPQTRERTFADTLAIAQTSAVQLSLASKNREMEAVGDHLGLGHECNALLALLYVNDPNYVPIPSSYRAGSGYEHRTQTHDVTIINQHWGEIHRFYPAEIKAAASLRDRQRYKALIVRGKMHLTVPGKYDPLNTTDAFARCYEGSASMQDQRIVGHATSTIRDLLALYQKGDCPDEFKTIRTQTKFHKSDVVAQKYKELSSEQRSA